MKALHYTGEKIKAPMSFVLELILFYDSKLEIFFWIHGKF